MEIISASEINRAQSLVLEKLKKKNLSGLLAAQRNGTLQEFMRPELETYLKKTYPNKIIPDLTNSNQNVEKNTNSNANEEPISNQVDNNNIIEQSNSQKDEVSENNSNISDSSTQPTIKTNKQIGSGLAARMATLNSNIPMPGSEPPPNIKKLKQNFSFEPTPIQFPSKHSATRAKRLRSDAEFGEIVNVNLYRPILHGNPTIQRKTPGRRHSLITGDEYNLVAIQLDNNVERESTGTRLRPSFSNSDLANYVDLDSILPSERFSTRFKQETINNKNVGNNNVEDTQNIQVESINKDHETNSHHSTTSENNNILPVITLVPSSSLSSPTSLHSETISSEKTNNQDTTTTTTTTTTIDTKTNENQISNNFSTENVTESQQERNISKENNLSENNIQNYSPNHLTEPHYNNQESINVIQSNPLHVNDEIVIHESNSNDEKIEHSEPSDSGNETIYNHPNSTSLSPSTSSPTSSSSSSSLENNQKESSQIEVQSLSRSPLHQSTSQNIEEGDQKQSISSQNQSTSAESSPSNQPSEQNESSSTSTNCSCCCIS